MGRRVADGGKIKVDTNKKTPPNWEAFGYTVMLALVRRVCNGKSLPMAVDKEYYRYYYYDDNYKRSGHIYTLGDRWNKFTLAIITQV